MIITKGCQANKPDSPLICQTVKKAGMPRNFLFVGFKAQFFRQRLSCSEKVGSDSQPVPLDLNAQRGKRRREHGPIAVNTRS